MCYNLVVVLAAILAISDAEWAFFGLVWTSTFAPIVILFIRQQGNTRLVSNKISDVRSDTSTNHESIMVAIDTLREDVDHDLVILAARMKLLEDRVKEIHNA